MNNMNDIERKFYNILSLIVEDAEKRKEKVIAIDSKTFKEVKGKEVKIKISTESLESMKKDIERIKNDNQRSWKITFSVWSRFWGIRTEYIQK